MAKAIADLFPEIGFDQSIFLNAQSMIINSESGILIISREDSVA